MTNVSIYLVVGSPAECIDYYQIEYKLNTSAGYTLAENQYTLPLYLYNLEDDANYDVRITPFCCNGQYGTPLIFVVSTTSLVAPTNFTATAGDTEVILDWDDMADADNYIVEMGQVSDYSDAVQIYSGSVSGHTETGLINGEEYFFRVKQQRTGFPDSDWSTDSAIPTL